MNQLERRVGLVALTLYGIGDILGSGIYGLVGKAAAQMGNFVWLAFLASFFVAMTTGLTYAALSSRYPKAAGSSWIVWKAFRSPILAFVIGLATLCSGLTSMATASRVFSGYFSSMVPVVSQNLAIFLFIAMVVYVVHLGIKHSLMLNAVFTLVEVTGLVLVIIAGLPYLGTVDLLDVSSIPSGQLSVGLVLSGAVLTFYSFVGFEDMINVGEEVKDAERTMPIALVLALVVASFVYIMVSVVAVSVLSPAQLGESKQPLVDVIHAAWPWFPPQLFSVIAMFAVANTALLNFIMGSRLLYGLGKLGLAPQALAKVHQARKTPTVSILFLGALLLILAYIGEITTLARSTSIFILLVFLAMNVSLIYFQREEKIRKRWTVPMVIPIAASLGAIGMLLNIDLADAAIAGTMLLVIVGLYFIRRPTIEQIENIEKVE